MSDLGFAVARLSLSLDEVEIQQPVGTEVPTAVILSTSRGPADA